MLFNVCLPNRLEVLRPKEPHPLHPLHVTNISRRIFWGGPRPEKQAAGCLSHRMMKKYELTRPMQAVQLWETTILIRKIGKNLPIKTFFRPLSVNVVERSSYDKCYEHAMMLRPTIRMPTTVLES